MIDMQQAESVVFDQAPPRNVTELAIRSHYGRQGASTIRLKDASESELLRQVLPALKSVQTGETKELNIQIVSSA